MKKLLLFFLLFGACKAGHNGLYINHTENDYVVADDTLEVRDSILIEHTGYRRKNNGVLMPKKFATKQLFELHPVFVGKHLLLNHATYEKH